MKLTLQQLARHTGGRVVGDDSIIIERVATLENAEPGDISFLTNSTYRRFLAGTRASAVILRSVDLEHCPVNALVVENPHAGYAKVASLLYPAATSKIGIHPAAVIDQSAGLADDVSIGPNCYIGPGVKLGKGVALGPGCVIEADVEIGDQSRLLANVTICHGSIIGKQALIHPGVVVGSDGFGQAYDNGVWLKIPQVGRVVIGDDVEIGANTTIDRGAIEDTVVGDNVKLDNQIQIAHNVHIGSHTVISGCTAVAGSTHIGRNCAIGGAVGIVGHLEITDNVQITAMSLVSHSIREPGVYSSGTPLEPNRQWHKNAVRFKQLNEMAKRIKELESRLGK